MSWTGYTDSLVAAKVEICAIHGRNGAPWAQAPGFSCTPDEVVSVVNLLSNNDTAGIFTNGAVIGGKRWTILRHEPDIALVVFKGKEKDNIKCTLTVAMSNQCVVLGANKDETVQGPYVRMEVEKMRDYLKGHGF